MTGPVASAAYVGSVYKTLGDFYAARPERKTSGEADYGVHWRGTSGRAGVTWRVSYVQATGEIYATQAGGRTEVLGWVQPDPDRRHEEGNFATGKTYYRTLDKVLEGWEHPHITGHKLSWVRRHLAAHREA